jgi:leucyl aminopeptidase
MGRTRLTAPNGSVSMSERVEFTARSASPDRLRTGCITVGVFEKRRLSDAAKALDRASGAHLGRMLRAGDLEGKVGQTLLLHAVPGVAADRVLLVGCGRHRELAGGQYTRVVASVARALLATGAADAALCLPELPVKDRDVYWKARECVTGARAALYCFDRMKTEKEETGRHLRRVSVVLAERREVETGERAVRDGTAIADGVDRARDLANLPPNVCTPTYLAEQAQEMTSRFPSLSTSVLDEQAMEKLGMGAFLAVARGSREPPRLIVVEHRGGAGREAKPIVLVGKGVTFDSGGISIKPAAAMDEMKFDMSGAAAVIAVMEVVAALALPLHVVGIVPSTENLPGGNATRPGDIVKSLSGQTIEVLNTDAEGRLILCDALTYAARYEPATVIDVATLTGACVVALGRIASGLFANHPPLAREILAAGEYAGDRAWELPLWEEYRESLKSNFADVANIGGPEAGAVTAAGFLARFTKKYRWAHLDIAGTAWTTGKEKGATGRPVPLLCQFLLDRLPRP